MEQFVARERLGGVDATLSAKVKRAVFGPYMAREDAGDETGGAAGMLTFADVCWRMLTYADVC
jgi:hypothetical protein